MSGIYDLEPIFLTDRNKYLGWTRDVAPQQRRSTTSATTTCRRWIIGCGEHDTAEFHRQPLAFLDATKKKGHKAQWIELAGRHHFAVSNAFGEDGPRCRRFSADGV